MRVYEQNDKLFLTSRPEQGSSVCWDVQVHQSRTRGTTNVNAGIDMTDCSRKIGLEFYYSTPADYKQRMDKLDTLIISLLQFRKAMEEGRKSKVESIIKFRREKKGERYSSKKTEKICDCGLSGLDD